MSDSSSDIMELDETAVMADPHIEVNLRRLQEEERLLLARQAAMETDTTDDIAALEHQDALRHNHLQQLRLHQLQQQELEKVQLLRAQKQQQLRLQQQQLAQQQELQDSTPERRKLERPAAIDTSVPPPPLAAVGAAGAPGRPQSSERPSSTPLDKDGTRRRNNFTVRVNNLHAAEAVETDV